MRLTARITATRAALALAGALALSAISAQAHAGGYLKERVYDDSFGNLIIISPSGYKRIVVGMGHVALELEEERRRAAAAYPPAAVGPDAPYAPSYTRCYQPPVLWKGRGYMYGLADGEIPTPPVICE